MTDIKYEGEVAIDTAYLTKLADELEIGEPTLMDIIGQLEKSRIEMEKNRLETEQMRADYERFKAEAEKTLNRRLKDAENELARAKASALSMVQSAKASADYVLEEIQKLQKKRESENLGSHLDQARRTIRENLRANEGKYDPVEDRRDENYVLPRPLRSTAVGKAIYLS